MANLHEAAEFAAERHHNNNSSGEGEAQSETDLATRAVEAGQRLVGDAVSRLDCADLWPVLDHSAEEIIFKSDAADLAEDYAPIELDLDDSMDEKRESEFPLMVFLGFLVVI